MKLHHHNPFFGQLEAEIMEILWRFEHASVRDVLGELLKKRPIAYTTVMTVMARLHEKGVLARTRDASGAYVYESKEKREVFLAEASKRLINSLIKEFGEIAVAQFIDIIETSNAKDLAKWRDKLKKLL